MINEIGPYILLLSLPVCASVFTVDSRDAVFTLKRTLGKNEERKGRRRGEVLEACVYGVCTYFSFYGFHSCRYILLQTIDTSSSLAQQSKS